MKRKWTTISLLMSLATVLNVDFAQALVIDYDCSALPTTLPELRAYNETRMSSDGDILTMSTTTFDASYLCHVAGDSQYDGGWNFSSNTYARVVLKIADTQSSDWIFYLFDVNGNGAWLTFNPAGDYSNPVQQGFKRRLTTNSDDDVFYAADLVAGYHTLEVLLVDGEVSYRIDGNYIGTEQSYRDPADLNNRFSLGDVSGGTPTGEGQMLVDSVYFDTGTPLQHSDWYDTDSDGMHDTFEQQIIDADPGDNITSLADVLPEDDFDHDGRTNIQEESDGTDPTDTGSVAGLVLYYSLDGSFNDGSGNNYDGLPQGDAQLAEDRFGIENHACRVGSTGGGYIDAGNHTEYAMDNQMSFATWLKAFHNSSFGVICLREGEYGFWVTSEQTLYWALDNYSPSWSTGVDTGVTLDIGEWNFVVFTYDSSIQKVKVYVNGTQVSEHTAYGIIDESRSNLDNLWLGARMLGTTGGPYQYFDGYLDEARLYNRALSSNEVVRLYAETRPIYDVTLEVDSALGNPSPAVGVHTNEKNDVVTCTVTNITVGTTQYVCTGWTGSGSVPFSGNTNSVDVTLTEDSSITWNWRTNYWLEVSVTGSGTVAVDGDNPWSAPAQTGAFEPAGSSPALNATGAYGWLFNGWTGDLSGDYTTSNTLITVDAPKSITALFSDDPDADGLKNTNEWAAGSDPRNPDTDGDNIDDNFEFNNGMSPTVSSAAVAAYILEHKAVFGHYTESELGELAVGPLMIDVNSGSINLQLQLRKSDNLNVWTNAGEAVEWIIPAGAGKYFYKVRAAE